jgi:hypothetical protein
MNKERCRCGFPLLDKEEICIACLPPRFRMTIGRYNLQIIESVIEDSVAC